MTVLNLLTALFIMTAMFFIGKPRLQFVLAASAVLAAPLAFGLVDRLDGLVFSLAGAALALILTMPLSLFGHVSRTEVLVSVALGGILGVVQYAIVFGIASVFLMVQRILGIESMSAAAARADGIGRCGGGLLDLDEQSALVEIEAMKILRKDRKEFEELAQREGYRGFEPGPVWAPVQVLPWSAKLAIATMSVLMIGTSL